MTEAFLVDGEDEDRWSIRDLRRDRAPMPGVDRLLAGAEPGSALEEMEVRLERLQQRVDELERLHRPTDGSSAPAAGYTLFFRGALGYEILDRDGVAPAVGTPIIVAGRRFVVGDIRTSPFPSDDRPCLVLSPPREVS